MKDLFKIVSKFRALKAKLECKNTYISLLKTELAYKDALNDELRSELKRAKDFKLQVLGKLGLIGYSQQEDKIYKKLDELIKHTL